jgi:cytoskeletal protein CcmA (bactofilin family)
MFGKKTAAPQARIDSLIGAGTRVDGSITFSGGLRIDGAVHGDVIGGSGQESTLVISEQATVEGEIRVAHVVVNGSVKGPIHATETLELQPRCRVTGDVYYNSLEMHLGAIVDGHLMHRNEFEGKTVELKVASRTNAL